MLVFLKSNFCRKKNFVGSAGGKAWFHELGRKIRARSHESFYLYFSFLFSLFKKEKRKIKAFILDVWGILIMDMTLELKTAIAMEVKRKILYCTSYLFRNLKWLISPAEVQQRASDSRIIWKMVWLSNARKYYAFESSETFRECLRSSQSSKTREALNSEN